MNFFLTNPFFLPFLLAAGLPVLFHLFLRIKKKTQRFPTLMFFSRINPQLSARRRIREWLLLLLRALLILLFILALLRPVWNGGGGGRIARVLVIDNSASMARPGPDGVSLLRRSVEIARGLLKALEPGDTAAIVLTVDDPSVTLPDGMTADGPTLLAALDTITATAASGDLPQAFAQINDLAGSASSAKILVTLFSDLQTTEWGRALTLDGPALTRARITVSHLVPSKKESANATLVSVDFPPGLLVEGRKAFADAVIRNTGQQVVQFHLNKDDDSGRSATVEKTLVPDEETRIPIEIGFPTAGLHWVNLWIEGDDFDGDNRAGIALETLPRQNVVFVGSRSDFGLLPTALSPTKDGGLTGMVPQFSTAGEFDANTLMAVLTWDGLKAHEQSVRRYLWAGGNVLIVPAPDSVGPYTALPEWLGASTGTAKRSPAGILLRVFERSSDLFKGLLNDQGTVSLGQSRAMRYLPLTGSPDIKTLIGLEDGTPLLLTRREGKGNLYLSGLSYDSQWTSLPLKGAFVVLMQNLALLHANETPRAVIALAGTRPALTDLEEDTCSIRTLSGAAQDWSGPSSELPTFPRSGVYGLTTAARALTLGIRSNPAEAAFEEVDTTPVPALAGLDHSVQPDQPVDEMIKADNRFRKSTDFYLPLILLALATLMAEGWIANPGHFKIRKRGEKEPR
jgi:hypothetical protein